MTFIYIYIHISFNSPWFSLWLAITVVFFNSTFSGACPAPLSKAPQADQIAVHLVERGGVMLDVKISGSTNRTVNSWGYVKG